MFLLNVSGLNFIRLKCLSTSPFPGKLIFQNFLSVVTVLTISPHFRSHSNYASKVFCGCKKMHKYFVKIPVS